MDLKLHLIGQMAFSHKTFGEGARTDGVISHIKKELVEVAEASGPNAAAKEWVDVVILGLDGLTRQLRFAEKGEKRDPILVARQACSMIAEKQMINENREWPDHRTADPNKAIEHVKK